MTMVSPILATNAPDFRDPSFLRAHAKSLMDFYVPRAIDPSGGHYQYFLDDGSVWDTTTRHLVSATRFVVTHSMLYRLTGDESYRSGLTHAIRFLISAFQVAPGEGYYWQIEWLDGKRLRVLDDTRHMYGMAFVMLAGAHGALCGVPEGRELLEDAYLTAEKHFWLPEHGLYADEANSQWELSAYRGQNANMHTCEAMIAAFEASGDMRYLSRAKALADGVVNRLGGQGLGKICEHYTTDWRPDWQYNRNDSSNIFRPWGYQPGHFVEWSKLLMQLDRFDPQAWHLEKARFLFNAAAPIAWDRENGGFHYGFGPNGDVCDPNKYHWVQSESISAAAILAIETGNPAYWEWYERTWNYCWQHFVDHREGSWFRILDRRNLNHTREKSPAGKVDYHPIGTCFDVLRALGDVAWAR